jgi:uncharacterized protein
MAGIRNRIENWFKVLSDTIYENRFKTLLIMILFVGMIGSQIPKITIDTSTEGFLHKSDQSLIDYEKFRDQFGREQMLVIALNPPDVFDKTFLENLKKLHKDLEKNAPYLEDITSLINARNTRGEQDELIVEDLLENWPQTPEEMEAIKKRVYENQMYQNMLISEDRSFTTIAIQTHAYSQKGNKEDTLGEFDEEFDTDMMEEDIPASGGGPKKIYLTDEENGEFVKAVEEIIARHNFPDTKIYMAGLPAVTHFLKRTMLRDMRKFMAIAVITIGFFLLVLFRRLSAPLMALFVVILSLFSTVGFMAFCGAALKLPTQILPSFILAVGVGDSVHILVIFFRRFDKTGNRKEAISYALGHSGLAVLMTSLTTASGLFSFSTAAVAPIADLGMFAAAGVMMALIYTIILLPALLSILPLKPKKHIINSSEPKQTFVDRLLDFIGSISIRYPWQVLFISGAIIVAAVLGLVRIEFSHNPVKWFPEDNPIRIANEKIDDVLKGSTSLEVIIDTKTENGLYDPAILNKLEKSATYMEDEFVSNTVPVGKAWSLTTVLKEINQALHANDKEFYSVPQDKRLVAQELLLFENSGSDDLEDFTDSQFSKARFTIKVPFIDAISFTGFIDDIDAYFKKTYPEAEVKSTGMVAILVRVITASIVSLRISYMYALSIITILMIILIGRVRIGLLSMIPNITPILIMLGIMGWMDIPMDLFSMMIGSISIGLAVDDTIHFMHNFRRYFEENNDAGEAVLQTLHSTGRAMLVTTCVLSIGFFTFMFATMGNLFNFGMLTGITITMALLSDYFIAPSLMIIVNRNRKNI